MNDIKTIGGVYTEEIKIILKNISTVSNCGEVEIYDLVPVQAGMVNIVLSFKPWTLSTTVPLLIKWDLVNWKGQK